MLIQWLQGPVTESLPHPLRENFTSLPDWFYSALQPPIWIHSKDHHYKPTLSHWYGLTLPLRPILEAEFESVTGLGTRCAENLYDILLYELQACAPGEVDWTFAPVQLDNNENRLPGTRLLHAPQELYEYNKQLRQNVFAPNQNNPLTRAQLRLIREWWLENGGSG
jgi:hypothetical protein